MPAALGFGGGLLQGLSQALMYKQQKREQQARTQQAHALESVKLLLDTGQVRDLADVEPLLGIAMPDVFGEKAQKAAGKGKAGQPDGAGMVRNILQSHIQGGHPLIPGPAAVQPEASPALSRPPIETGEAVGQGTGPMAPPLESRLFAMPAQSTKVPAQAPRTLFGVPLMTPEEAASRKFEIEANTKLRQAQFIRDKFYPALKAVDPNATLDNAAAWFGVRTPQANIAPSYSEIPGEVVGADGKVTPVSGILDHRTGQILDPITRKPIEGFRHRVTGGAGDLGDLNETAAKALGFQSASEAGAAGRMNDVIAKAREIAGGLAGTRATESTTARTAAEAKAPLSTEQRVQTTIRLRDQWFNAQRPAQVVKNQLGVMETGLKRYLAGDKVGGSSAILTTFQKILDPETGVREAEYNRIPEGMGLKQRLEGFVERLQSGGAGIPDEEMKGIVETGRQIAKNFETYNDALKDAIQEQVKKEGLTERLIFGAPGTPGSTQTAAPGGGKTTPTTPPAPPGMEWRDGQLFIKSK